MRERKVIEAFISHLRSLGHPGLRVDSWPDKTNSVCSDIDAISGIFAIEHTSIDTLPDQRRDADWFMRVVTGLDAELSRSLPYRLRITLEYRAVRLGQDWTAIRAALKTWISGEVPLLADGTHRIDNIAGIPFPLHVSKISSRPPGLFFARYEPFDDTLSSRIRIQLDRKAEKLLRYHTAGQRTVLLVESYDIALMNTRKMHEAIRGAYPTGLPSGVDELWYADTSIPGEIDFHDLTPLVGGSAAQQHG